MLQWLLRLLFKKRHRKRGRTKITFSNVVADHSVFVTFKRDKRRRF